MIKKITSIFLAIIICTLGTISSNAVECQAHEYQNEEKIDSRLKEKLETMNDDIVRVWIWFNGIDESKLASNVKQRCGFEEKDFEISVSESHIEAAVLLESDRNNFQSSTVEKIVEEYKKDNVLFNEKIKENFNSYRNCVRKVSSEMHSVNNNDIMKNLHIDNNEIIFMSTLTPSAIIKTSKYKIIEIGTL